MFSLSRRAMILRPASSTDKNFPASRRPAPTGQIEEVAALLALVQGAQFRPEQFVQLANRRAILTLQEPRDFDQIFTAHFADMTAEPVTAAALLDVRERLLQRISELLDAPSRAFLESIEREAPDFSLIGLPRAADLPGVRRKLSNLGRRTAEMRTDDYAQLVTVLGSR